MAAPPRKARTKAAPRAPTLKVYAMPAGFYDAIVAAPSQAAALRAWGTSTDLFAAGRAALVDDEAIRAQALARPGEVIRRSRGDEAAMLGPEPDPAPTPPALPRAGRRAPAPPLPPDRSALDANERALAAAEREVSAERDALAAERAEMDRREAEMRAAGEARLAALTREREAAAAEYKRAGRRAGERR